MYNMLNIRVIGQAEEWINSSIYVYGLFYI